MTRHAMINAIIGAATGGSLTTEALGRVLAVAQREVAEAEAEAGVDWARARVAQAPPVADPFAHRFLPCDRCHGHVVPTCVDCGDRYMNAYEAEALALATAPPRNASLEQTAARMARSRMATVPDGGTAASAAPLKCACTTGVVCAFCTTYGGMERP